MNSLRKKRTIVQQFVSLNVGVIRKGLSISYQTLTLNTIGRVSTIILLYHKHAICEQYHSELTHDLDSERLPSGKFSTNTLTLT